MTSSTLLNSQPFFTLTPKHSKHPLTNTGRPRNNPLPPNASSPVHSPLMKHNLPLKKKLHAIAKYLLEYTCSDGRQPMLLFMEKPSKKLYPHYYNVIEKPIDMITIESNIKVCLFVIYTKIRKFIKFLKHLVLVEYKLCSYFRQYFGVEFVMAN